jgi:hypothetical protein
MEEIIIDRDAGMIMLEKPRVADEDPTTRDKLTIATQMNNRASRTYKAASGIERYKNIYQDSNIFENILLR